MGIARSFGRVQVSRFLRDFFGTVLVVETRCWVCVHIFPLSLKNTDKVVVSQGGFNVLQAVHC